MSEWFGESGINVSYPDDADPFIRLEYRRPPAREVTIDAGKLVFAPELTSPGVVYAADWSISTRTTMHVAPVAPCTAAELNRSFAQPLRALTSFVSDRPDSLTIERLMNAQTQRETVIWRVAPQTEVRSWHVISDYLFRVRDADNIEALIGRWWALYEAVDPALGHFAQHLNAGSMYSPERLVVVIAALEAYGDIQHNTTDLRALRNQTGVASSVTGCTNAALDLLGASRGYFAHPSKLRQKHGRDDAGAGVFPSIRRASALMQACLLRDLGFTATRVTQLLGEHYRSWPIP